MHHLHRTLFESLTNRARHAVNGIMCLSVLLLLAGSVGAAERAVEFTETYHHFTGPKTGVTVNYALILPDGYETSGKDYPVIYYLHGLNSAYNFSGTDAHDCIAGAIQYGLLEPMIVVAPDAYFNSWWYDASASKPAETNFIEELIPYIDENYRVKKGAANRLLTGFSMGGHGAFYYAVKYPEMFCATFAVDAACQSTDVYTQYIDRVREHQPKIYNVGAQRCGDRHERVVNAFKDLGVEFPYVYVNLPHYYPDIIREDQDRGWAFLQSELEAANAAVAIRIPPKLRSPVPETFNAAAMAGRTVFYSVNGRKIAATSSVRGRDGVGARGFANMMVIDPTASSPRGTVIVR